MLLHFLKRFSIIVPSVGSIMLCWWQLVAGTDSLQVKYAIVGMNFYGDHDVVKIKVPPWLHTSELMDQIKLSILSPAATLPTKKTYVYVFKETDQVGDISSIGAMYTPGKGFSWSLSDWIAWEFPDDTPSNRDLEIYYTLVDQIVDQGSTLDNLEIRQHVSQQYSLTLSELDSIYSWVKYWIAKQQNKRK